MEKNKKILVTTILIIVLFLLSYGLKNLYNNNKSLNHSGNESAAIEDTNSPDEKDNNDKKDNDGIVEEDTEDFDEQDNGNQKEDVDASDGKNEKNDVLVKLNQGGNVNQDVYINSYNQNYGPKKSSIKSTIDGDLYILEDQITIRNTKVRGTIYVDPGADATTHLENVDAYKVVVLSGADHSIYFENLTTDKLEIDSSSYVRVVVDKGTKIKATTVKSNSIIYNVENEDGTFGVVEILNDGEVILSGDFTDEVIVRSGVDIKTTENTQVENLKIETDDEDAEVKLSGKFKDIKVERPVKLKIVDDSIISNIVTNSDTKIFIDKDVKIDNLDTKKKEVSIYGLYVGNTFKLNPNIEDFNFDNEENINLKYVSEDETVVSVNEDGTVVSVNEDGTVKGMNPGETNVKIKASNGEEEKIISVSITVVNAPPEIAILIANNSINLLPEEDKLKYTHKPDVQESRRLVDIAVGNKEVDTDDIDSYDKLVKLEKKIGGIDTAITNAINTIENLPSSEELKYTDKDAVEAARALVETALGKDGVVASDITNLDKLEALETRISEMNTAITNTINAIENLPSSEELKYTDKAAVEAARVLVETALGIDGVEASDIANLDKLEALETRIGEMNTAIINAINAIKNLPSSEELKYTDKDAVEAARDIVESALGIAGVETTDITNLDKLETLETRMGKMNTGITNAKNIIENLPSIEELKYTDKPAVVIARLLVNVVLGIDGVEATDITNLDKLETLETRISEMNTGVTNAINAINNLPSSEELKYTDKAAVEAARILVNVALGIEGVEASDITNLDKLETLETRISEMNTAVTNAINAIENLPSSEELKYTDKAAVEASRALVETALGIAGVETSDITNLDKLETLETRIGEMNTGVTNAINAIENLPSSEELKYTDKAAVEAARILVNVALGIEGVEASDITNLDKLETLETRISEMNTAVTNAINAIENLPSSEELKYTDKAAVEAARTLVESALGIDGIVASDITNLDKLEVLETKISKMNTAVTNAINAIENLSSSEELKYTDKAAVEAARTLVESALGIDGIVASNIANLDKLEALETRIGEMNTAITNAKNAIENLPSSEELKYTDKAAVEAGRAIVETALGTDGVEASDITNLEKLETLETRISEMNTAITNAVNAIENLPTSEEIKYTDKAAVEAARASVETALGIEGVEASDIANLDKLEGLETRISEMNTAITNAVNAIENLPSSEELKYADKVALEAARALVNVALGIEGVEASDITNLDKLETLETRISEMNTAVTNAKNAIENLPSSEELKYADKAAVAATRALVEIALGIDGVETSDITNLDKLETLETRISEMNTGVTNAINAIENLPSSEELKYTDKAAVEAARALVETSLGIDGVETSDIANLDKLETLENKIIELSTVKLPTSNIETNSEIGTDTEIILSSETESAAIYYTIDGSTPDKNSILYDSSIKINKDTTIKAIAVKEGMYDSEVSTFVYTVATGVVAGKIDIQDKEDDSNTEVTLEGISDKGKEVSRETKSDVNGDFTFTGVPAGDYIIKTYMDGYFVNTINVRVEENQEVTLDKELILYVERSSGSVKGVAKFIGNEDNSGIYVKVQTLDGEPLPNIIVLTDEQGNYTIDKIPVAEGENSSTYVLTAYPLENDGTMISDSIVVTVIKDQTVTISDTLWVRPKPDAVFLIADDYTPWTQNAPEQLINELGVSYTKYNSSQIASLELPLDKVVWILNDQPQNFYNVYAQNQAKFDKFVSDGGTMLFEACDGGWNGGSLENAGATLPGGVINRLNYDGVNNNINPTHPMMKGIPEKLYGNSASHNYFIGLPDVATILTQDTKGNVTATEYKHDKGRVISTGQPLEFYWNGTNPLKDLYTNLLKYTFDKQ